MIVLGYKHPEVADLSMVQDGAQEPVTDTNLRTKKEKKNENTHTLQKQKELYVLRVLIFTSMIIFVSYSTLSSSEGRNPPIHKKNLSADVFHIPDIT